MFVFLFFGVVAVAGSAFVQLEEWPTVAILASVPVGALAAAVLVVNNVRDRETDARVGKRTLAVRLGPERGRDLYTLMIIVAYAMLGPDRLGARIRLAADRVALLPACHPLEHHGAHAPRRTHAERRPGGHGAA